MGLTTFTLTSAEMLRLWKETAMYETPRLDCAVERTDGIDLDQMLSRRIDAWYARQLLEAPADILPLSEIAPRLTPVRLPCGAAEVGLPEETVRIVSVMMEGWGRPALVTADPASPLAVRQLNPFGRSGCAAPVAVVHPDSRMMLYSPPPAITPRLLSVTAVMRPADGSYILTDPLISLIPDYHSY